LHNKNIDKDIDLNDNSTSSKCRKYDEMVNIVTLNSLKSHLKKKISLFVFIEIEFKKQNFSLVLIEIPFKKTKFHFSFVLFEIQLTNSLVNNELTFKFV